MVRPKIIVGLDIGTTSVKVVVAEYANQRLNVIGVGKELSDGSSRGVIVDVEKTVIAIQRAVHQAEQRTNLTIDDVIVGVPSNQINIEPCYGMVVVPNDNHEITDKDVRDVLSAAKVRNISAEREIISVIPEEFIVDGFDGIRDPRGMIGVRLELYANMITGPKTIMHNIRRAVEKAGLKVSAFVVQPIAGSQVAMNDDERAFGTIFVDFGGGQTTASVMHDRQLKFSYVDQEGGEYVSKDISTVLNTTLENAERMKLEYGYATAQEAKVGEVFPVNVIGKKEPVQTETTYLAEIIEAREVQILQNLKKELDRVEAFDLPGGVVISGGAAMLPGMLELTEEIFEKDVRLYVPEQVGLRDPSYTTAYGLVRYAANMPEIYHVAQNDEFEDNKEVRPASTSFSSPYEENETQTEVPVENRPASVQPTQTQEEDIKLKNSQSQSQPTAQPQESEQEGFIERIKNAFDQLFS